MIKRMLLSFIALSFLGAAGCAHVDRERADYHHDQAKKDAEHGHFVKAVHQQEKANQANRDADQDPVQ